MAGKRPGLTSVAAVDPQVQAVAAPLNDLVNRVTGVTLPKITKLKTAALPNIKTADALAQLFKKVNELIDRLQED